jgi:hypothetical protein
MSSITKFSQKVTCEIRGSHSNDIEDYNLLRFGAEGSFETLVAIQQTTWHHITESSNIYFYLEKQNHEYYWDTGMNTTRKCTGTRNKYKNSSVC